MFCFRTRPEPLAPTDNLRIYLSKAVLPHMIHGASAPPLPQEGHKAHLNHLAVRPEGYRSRFIKIVAPKQVGVFDMAVLDFVDTLPTEKLNVPNLDETTGYACTVPAAGFNIGPQALPRPTTVQEVSPWVLGLPLQTMARALHIAFPAQARPWDVTYVSPEDDARDAALWHTLVWRRTPPPSHPETYWRTSTDPLEKCSVVFAVQPPWVLSAQDFRSFMRCTSLPPVNPWDPRSSKPYTGAERVWAKLWDTCVRRSCHHWVLSTYWGWAFGAFTEGFTAGQILDLKTHDAENPTVLECLIYHVACSIGLAEGSTLPQYIETLDDLQWNRKIPQPSYDAEIKYPDSGSEWEGMDDEPGISAGVSEIGRMAFSAFGSDRGHRSLGSRVGSTLGHASVTWRPDRTEDVMRWNDGVAEIEEEDLEFPEPLLEEESENERKRERSSSPGAASEAAASGVSVYKLSMRSIGEGPNLEDVVESAVESVGEGGRQMWGSTLATIAEQGPEEELVDEMLRC